MAADTGAALLAAAVKAAILAGAPRRTVQAVAAAVTGVLVRPVMAAAEPGMRSAAVRQETTSVDADLVETLRLRRRARRHRKKAERRDAKARQPTDADVVDDDTKEETSEGAVASDGGGQPVPTVACGLTPHEQVANKAPTGAEKETLKEMRSVSIHSDGSARSIHTDPDALAIMFGCASDQHMHERESAVAEGEFVPVATKSRRRSRSTKRRGP
jgi:hypothetical protein